MDTEPTFFETNATPGVVGQPLSRVDGWAKVTGQVRYSAEFNTLPGLTHAVLKISEVARGRITGLDASAAQRAPGVLAILTHQNLSKLAVLPGTPEGKKALGMGVQMGSIPLTSDQIYYAGQPVAVVVADTLERAQHAAALLQVRVASEQPVVSYQDSQAQLFDPEKVQAGKADGHIRRGNPEEAFRTAPVQLRATYTHAINHHSPMEPGATTAHWETPERLTVYDATQGVTRTQQTLSALLRPTRRASRFWRYTKARRPIRRICARRISSNIKLVQPRWLRPSNWSKPCRWYRL